MYQMQTWVLRQMYQSRPEYCDIAKVQWKDLNMAFMDMIEALKEEMNESIKEIY